MSQSESWIGQGAFGKVFKVERNGKTYAIKKINMSSTDNEALKEQNILETVDHPYIIKYFRSYVEGPNLCLQMEFADLGTFATLTEQNAQLADTVWFKEWNVWRTLWHMADALRYLHTRQTPILHRDVKPDNILAVSVYVASGKKTATLKLSDFGLSKMVSVDALGKFYASSICGTPIYMAPQIVREMTKQNGSANYSWEVDIWAMGCVFVFFCNRGKHLFNNPTDVINWTGLTLGKIQGRYSFDLQSLLGRMLQPNPGERPSAAEILAECTEERQEIGKH